MCSYACHCYVCSTADKVNKTSQTSFLFTNSPKRSATETLVARSIEIVLNLVAFGLASAEIPENSCETNPDRTRWTDGSTGQRPALLWSDVNFATTPLHTVSETVSVLIE